MREGKFRVGRERRVEQRLAPGIGRQQQIARADIILHRRGRRCRNWQPETVLERHPHHPHANYLTSTNSIASRLGPSIITALVSPRRYGPSRKATSSSLSFWT